jgi:hypothetical protein
MAPKGYITYLDVAALLQVTFTAGQQALATTLIEQAEAVVDTMTNRGWMMGVQTLEQHLCPGATVLLDYFPITAVAEVRARTGGIGSVETTLTVDVDYEIYNAAAGSIHLAVANYDRVRVTYTPSTTVPPEIKRAMTELVAAWIQPALISAVTGGQAGVEVLKLPDLEVKFAKSAQVAASGQVPPSVMEILMSFRIPPIG